LDCLAARAEAEGASLRLVSHWRAVPAYQDKVTQVARGWLGQCRFRKDSSGMLAQVEAAVLDKQERRHHLLLLLVVMVGLVRQPQSKVAQLLWLVAAVAVLLALLLLLVGLGVAGTEKRERQQPIQLPRLLLALQTLVVVAAVVDFSMPVP